METSLKEWAARSGGSSRRSALIWLPLPVFVGAVAVIHIWQLGGTAESPVVLTTLNALFCGSTSLALAFLAANTYRATAQRGLLALACAALTMSVVFLLAAPLVAVSLDVALILHNGGLLGAAALFVLSAFWISRDDERQAQHEGPWPHVWLAFSAVTAGLALLTVAALAGATPAFFTPAQGVTPVRQAVLGAAVLGFVAAAGLTCRTRRRGGSSFLRWYAVGLVMMAIGLATVWLGQPGSAVNWAGRAAQWVAGVYLFIASVSAIVDSGRWRIALSRALRESEHRYANLATMSPDAIIVQAKGVCVFANPAAVRLLGAASPAELIGSDVAQFFRPDLQGIVARRIEEARGGNVLPADEYVVLRADGSPVPVEVTGARVGHQGSPAVQLVMRDVSARLEAEAVQREHEAEQIAQEERGRIARDLHDSVTQSLFAATLRAEALAASCDGDPGVTAAADEVVRLDRGALAQMRTLLLELRGDPVAAVPIRQLLGNLVEAAESRAAVRVSLMFSGASTLPPGVHEAAYRITQEALNNVVRHARASTAYVQFIGDRSPLRLVIGDDGCGFDPTAVSPGHYGLRSMSERAAASGGELALVSAAGRGTELMVEWRVA